MIHRIVILTGLLTFLFPGMVLSREAAPSAADHGGRVPLKAEMAVSLSAGMGGAYLTADPSVVWKPGAFALGLGAEFPVGVSQFEIYAQPYLRAELGWFVMVGGYIFPLVPGGDADDLTGASLGMGIAPEPFTLGYGRLGFELAVDTSVPAYLDGLNVARGSSILRLLLVAGAVSSRVSLGVTYSFLL